MCVPASEPRSLFKGFCSLKVRLAGTSCLSTGGSRPKSGLQNYLDWVVALWAVTFFEKKIQIYIRTYTYIYVCINIDLYTQTYACI